MRLYCPSCRAMYDEPDDRFHAAGGNLPCRVCMTPLVPQRPSDGFSPDAATIVAEPPSVVMKKGPVMGGAAGGDVGYSGDGQKTTMLDANAIQGLGMGGMSPPPQPQAPRQPGGGFGGNSQRGHGGGAPSGQRGSGGGGSNFHNDATHIFDMPRPNNPPPPMPTPGGGSGGAPPPQQQQQSSGPPPSHKMRGQVVIGGAAGSGTASESLKTQAFDVKVIADKTQQDRAIQTGMMPRDDIPEPGGAPSPNGGPTPGQVVVGSDFSSHAAPPTDVRRRGKGLLIGLAVLIVAGLTTGALFLFGVIGGGGGGSDSDDDEEGSPAASARAAGPRPADRADLALRELRTHLEPATAYSGESARTEGYVIGVGADDTGITGYWAGGNRGTQAASSIEQATAAIGDADVPTYALFDVDVPVATVVSTLDTLTAAGKHAHLAAGSPVGEDVYYAFAATGSAEADIRVQLGTGGIVMSAGAWPEPRTFCYSSLLPSDMLMQAMESLVGAAPESEVAVTLSPDTDLNRALALAGALTRPGLRLHLALAEADPTPAECTQ